ncbi:MAG: hypothetical protein JOY62_11575 [Acidobacteriaceae bacterium]|nr:hypothetical protein [Acidobacteriaceae bacterium]MBV9780599.1 hypothetical protein [Acidobacteriaceae bacterium]
MIVTVALSVFLVIAEMPTPARDDDLLEQGYKDMYNLAFNEAHEVFQRWEINHPADPLGPASDAAAYLFSEFHRLNILQSEFFVNDSSFFHRNTGNPDPRVKREFQAALNRSRTLAEAILQRSPDDRAALFAIVLRLGLQADYTALIEKRYLASLDDVKQARSVAEQLLARYPDCYDAYLAIGVENYLLSLKPAPVRWLLRMRGAETDKTLGLAKLQLTAEKGHYLAPYAELLLAVAALRDKRNGDAQRILADLAARFPRNELYRTELQKAREGT